MRWLAECSAAALGAALRVVAPELSGFPVTVFDGFDAGLLHVLTQFRSVLAAQEAPDQA